MKVYLILDEFGWQATLQGIFTNKEEAENARNIVIQNYTIDLLKHAEKNIQGGIKNHEQWIKTDEYFGRIVERKRAEWFDYSPERYVKEFIIKIKEAKVDEIIDLNIYAE